VSALSGARRSLRERSEHHLRLAVLRELGRGEPSTVEPYRPPGGFVWRALFVPVYRRLPWSVKERALDRLGMTARGWQPPARRAGEPWRPPPGLTPPPRPADSPGPPPQA